MSDDDKFFERLRADAGKLRYQPDEVTLARIRARIHDRLEHQNAKPGVLELLAAWFRPLAATLTAIAIAAAIGVNSIDTTDTTVLDPAVEISMAGDTYSVGH
ncbi:MAG TPA: hypothetical protein VEK57_08745 [Thermoanaerobaculia bacterium]|nr:hypothetical protein [Thermoanaerobaculia bacterium]